MTNLNQIEYNHIREQIAKQIATTHYPYNANGIIVRDTTITRDDFWNMQSDDYKEKKLLQAQAAMDVMASIGWQNVIAIAFDKYVEEK